MNKYIITEASDNEWNDLLNKSNGTTFFYEIFFLNSVGKKVKKIILKKKNIVKSGVAFIYDEKKIVNNKFLIYSGILFNHEKSISINSKINDELKMTTIIIDFLIKKYKEINISTFIENNDLRPFNWLLFDKKVQNLNFNLKYTALLDISSFKDYEDDSTKIKNYTILSESKKEMIRKSFKKKKKVIFDKNPKHLIDSYRYMKQNNDLNWDDNDIESLKKIVESTTKMDKGIFCHIDDEFNNRLCSVFYSWDKTKAYFLYGGTNLKIKNDWVGVTAHWQMFKYLANQKKIFLVDLEGINSPKRGYFKTSFGTEIKNYFNINLKNF